MNDYRIYLLRTESQLEDFRRRYASYIASEEAAYLKWIRSWPLMEWVDYLYGVPKSNIPVLIGMICHLYCSGKVNVSFHDSMLKVRRDPESEEEWRGWKSQWKGTCSKKSGKI